MRTLLTMLVFVGALSAQEFHGVSIIAGPGNLPVLVNHSTQTLIGFAVDQGGRLNAVLDLNSVAYDKPVAPGESRPMPGLAIFGGFATDEVVATLFGDGTFYGPEQVFQDFAHRIRSIRDMAKDVQNSGDRFGALAKHASQTVDVAAAARKRGERVDFKALQHRSTMAQRLMDRRNYDGDEAVNAAVDKIAALPEVVKGDPQ